MAQIKKNGWETEGVASVVYSPFEKALATLITGLLVASVAAGIAMYREIGVISERQKLDAEAIRTATDELRRHQDIPFHVGVYQNFVTRAEFDLAMDHKGR